MTSSQLRMIYTSEELKAFPEYKGKVFLLIGPFESFSVRPEVQLELEAAIGKHNRSQSLRKGG